MRHFLFLIVLGITLCIILGFLGTWWWGFDLLSNFYLQYFVVLAPVLAILMFLKAWRYVLFSSVVFIFLLFSIFSFVYPKASSLKLALTDIFPIRVMSFNMFYANTEYQDIADYINRTQPDVVILTEINAIAYQELGIRLDEYRVQDYVSGPHASDLAVFSKLSSEEIRIEKKEGVVAQDAPIVRIAIHHHEKDLVIYSSHLLPPMNNQRNHELAALENASLLEKSPHIVIGDLNLTPWSPYFRNFLKTTGLRDSRRGNGLGLSWGAQRSVFLRLPLDHAFVSKDLSVVGRFLGPNLGSDHFPLIVYIN